MVWPKGNLLKTSGRTPVHFFYSSSLSRFSLSPPSALTPIGNFDRAHLDTQRGIGAGLKWRSYPGRRLEQQESGGVEGAGEECRKRRSDSSSISWLGIWQSRIRIEVSDPTYLSLPVAEIPVPLFVSDFCCGFWLQGDMNISPRALPVLLCNLVGESTWSDF
ncbi:uncharacterized protein LOC120662557 [Panicum virgatum]|uniref:uncharacterized protein LOC120662557 n=1 Tax=Panicum virgatum TaxID=38727 RepID=UPI0019D61FD0|nr:uncharacterized protein LOC120662557 [Panicum virgatum]